MVSKKFWAVFAAAFLLCFVEHGLCGGPSEDIILGVDTGWHTYGGSVKCKFGTTIWPNAYVKLMEKDFFKNDQLFKQDLYTDKNKYKSWWEIRKFADDGLSILNFSGQMQLYYEFRDVCFQGQVEYATPAVDGSFDYIL